MGNLESISGDDKIDDSKDHQQRGDVPNFNSFVETYKYFQPLESDDGLPDVAHPLQDFVLTYGGDDAIQMEIEETKDPLLEETEVDIFPIESTTLDGNNIDVDDQTMDIDMTTPLEIPNEENTNNIHTNDNAIEEVEKVQQVHPLEVPSSTISEPPKKRTRGKDKTKRKKRSQSAGPSEKKKNKKKSNVSPDEPFDYTSIPPIVDSKIVSLENFRFKSVGHHDSNLFKPVDIYKLVSGNAPTILENAPPTTKVDTSTSEEIPFLSKTPTRLTNGKKHVGPSDTTLPFDVVSTFHLLKEKLAKPSCINSLDHVNPLNITMNQITNFNYLALNHRKNYMMSWIRRVCLNRAIECCRTVLHYNNKIIYRDTSQPAPVKTSTKKNPNTGPTSTSSSNSFVDNQSSKIQEMQDLSNLYQEIGQEALRFWKHLKKIYIIYARDIKKAYEYLVKKSVLDLTKKKDVYGSYPHSVSHQSVGFNPFTKSSSSSSSSLPAPLLVPQFETCQAKFEDMGMGPKMTSDFFLKPEKNFNRAAICFEFTRMDLQIFSAAVTSFFSERGFLAMFPVLVNIRTDKRTPLYHQLEQLLSYFFIILRKGFRFGKTYSLMDSMGMGKTFQHIMCFSFLSNAFGWLLPVQKLEQLDPYKQSVIDFEQAVYECEGGNQFYEWIYSGFYDVQEKETLRQVTSPFSMKRETFGSFKMAVSVADRIKNVIKEYCEKNSSVLSELAMLNNQAGTETASDFLLNQSGSITELEKISRLCKLLFILQNSSPRVSRKLDTFQDVIGFESYLSSNARIETRYHLLREILNITSHYIEKNPEKDMNTVLEDLKSLDEQFSQLNDPHYWFSNPQSSVAAMLGNSTSSKAATDKIQVVLNNLAANKNLLGNALSSSSKKSSKSKKKHKEMENSSSVEPIDREGEGSSTGSVLRDADVDTKDVDGAATLDATAKKSRMGSEFLHSISNSKTNKLFALNQIEEDLSGQVNPSSSSSSSTNVHHGLDDITSEDPNNQNKTNNDLKNSSSSQFGNFLATLWPALGSPVVDNNNIKEPATKNVQSSFDGRSILAKHILEKKTTLIKAMTDINSRACKFGTLSTVIELSAVPQAAINKFIPTPPDMSQLNSSQARDENVNHFVRSLMKFPTRILDYFFNNQTGITHLSPIVFCTLGTVGEWIEESTKVMTNPKIAVFSLGSVKRYKNLYMPTSSSAFFNNIEQFSHQRNVDLCETISQYQSFKPSCVVIHHDIIGKLIDQVQGAVEKIITTVRGLHVTDNQLTKFCEHVKHKSIVKLMYDVFKNFNDFVLSNSFLVEFVVMADYCRDGKEHFENLFKELKEERWKVEGKKNITIFMRNLQWASEGADLFITTYGHVGYWLNILFNDAVRAELEVLVPKLRKMSERLLKIISEKRTQLKTNKAISLAEKDSFDDELSNILGFCQHHSEDLMEKIATLQSMISERAFGELPPMALYMMSSEYSAGFDESHKLRNQTNKLHQSFKSLPTQHRSFLSGTPINNDLTDELLTFINLWRSAGPWTRERELSLYDIHKPLDFPEYKPKSFVKYVLGLEKPASAPWMLPKSENFLDKFTKSKARINLALSANMVILMQLHPSLTFMNSESKVSITYGGTNSRINATKAEPKEMIYGASDINNGSDCHHHSPNPKIPNFLEGVDNLSEFSFSQKLLFLSHLFCVTLHTPETITSTSAPETPFDFNLLFNSEQFLTLVVTMWYNHLPKTFYVRDFLTKSVDTRTSRTHMHPFRSKATYFDCINDVLFYQNCCESTYHAAPQVPDKLGKSLSFLTDNSMNYDIDPTYIRRIMDKPWNSTAISQTLIYATNHSPNGENICRACGSPPVPFSEYRDSIDINSKIGFSLIHSNGWHYVDDATDAEKIIQRELDQLCSNEFSVGSPGYKEKLVSASKFMRMIMYNILDKIMQKKGQKGDNLCRELKRYFYRTGTQIVAPIEQEFKKELEVKTSWGCMCYSSHQNDFEKSLSHLSTLISTTLYPEEEGQHSQDIEKPSLETEDSNFDTKLLLFVLKYISFRLQKNYGGCIRHNPLSIYSDHMLSESCRDAVGNLQVMGLGFFGMDVKMTTFYRMAQHSVMLYIKFQRYLEGRKDFALTEFRDWFYTKSQEHSKLPYFKKIEDNLPFFKTIFPTFPTTTTASDKAQTGTGTTPTISTTPLIKKLPLTETVKMARGDLGKTFLTLITPSGNGTVAPPLTTPVPDPMDIDDGDKKPKDAVSATVESSSSAPEVIDFIPTEEEIALADKLVGVITKDYTSKYLGGASREIPWIPMYKKLVVHPRFFWGKTVGRPRKFTTVFSAFEQKVYLHYHSRRKDEKMEELFKMIESNTNYSGIIENHESYKDMFHFMLGSITNCISASADYRCKIPRSYPKCLRNGAHMIKTDWDEPELSKGEEFYDSATASDNGNTMFKKLTTGIEKGEVSEKSLAGFYKSAYGEDMIEVFLSLNYYGKDSLNPRMGLFDIDKLPSKYLLLAWYIINKTNITQTKHLKPDGSPIRKYDFDSSSSSSSVLLSKSSPATPKKKQTSSTKKGKGKSKSDNENGDGDDDDELEQTEAQRAEFVANLQKMFENTCHDENEQDEISEDRPDHLPDRVVVFTNGTMYLDNLAAFLEYFLAIKVSIYAGSNSERSKDKEDNLKEFKNGNSHVLLSSLSSGGTGLNLEIANVVITYENWWNPNAEEQGKDRIRRISQQRKVRFALFSIVGGVDDVITHIGDAKESMINNIFKGHGGIKRADDSAVEHVIFDREKLARVFSRPGTKVVVASSSSSLSSLSTNSKNSNISPNLGPDIIDLDAAPNSTKGENNKKEDSQSSGKAKSKATFKLSTPHILTENQIAEIVSRNTKTRLGFYDNPEANVQLFNSFWTSSFTKTVKPIIAVKNKERRLLNIYLASRKTIELLGQDAGRIITTSDFDPIDDSDGEKQGGRRNKKKGGDSNSSSEDSDSDSENSDSKIRSHQEDSNESSDGESDNKNKKKNPKKKTKKAKSIVISSGSEGEENGNADNNTKNQEPKKKRKRSKKNDKKEQKRKKKKAKSSSS